MWKSWTFFPSDPLFSCSVGDQTQGLIFAGKCSGCKLCLQSDVERSGTDAKIIGSGKVFRKLNIKPLYVPDFLDMEMKTGVHRELWGFFLSFCFLWYTPTIDNLCFLSIGKWVNKIELIHIVAFLISAKERTVCAYNIDRRNVCVPHAQRNPTEKKVDLFVIV